MNKLIKFFPYIILISGLLVSITGSYYSIYGIGKIFAGHKLGAIFMAFSLELGNVVTASALKIYWNDLPKMLRNYLCSAVVVLSIITSIGIYGFLSDGYQLTYNKDKIVESKIQVVEKKKLRFENQLIDLKKEKEEVNISISNLRKSLATDNQYQTVDKRGNVLTQIQSTSKKGVQQELNIATSRLVELTTKIDNLHDSVSVYDLKVIELNSSNDVSAELGALKYISNISGVDMNSVVNWFLILLMVVFQPLAISLLLTALFAFGKKEEDTTIPEIIEEVLIPVEVSEDVPVTSKKSRKKREKKVQTDEIQKTFNIEIEGLEPVDENIVEEQKIEETTETNDNTNSPKSGKLPEEYKKTPEKKTRKRIVVERSLTDNLARHISENINKKKA